MVSLLPNYFKLIINQLFDYLPLGCTVFLAYIVAHVAKRNYTMEEINHFENLGIKEIKLKQRPNDYSNSEAYLFDLYQLSSVSCRQT
ncbi:MAG: hypothetical protein CFH06_00702 [Alphaproteobacteria bacterium MarineAlpha3_Bin5]|nr:hypothetical protein [Magnetovibrio sp.]PPR78674.1 MAG: hypothetical protein CFH06_00702 [Alphaproteobacteria bacterium MarineAlpha3_Bin5]